MVEPPRALVDGGHFPLPEIWVPIARRWFDETLGPVPSTVGQ
jgi:hypothetical protein